MSVRLCLASNLVYWAHKCNKFAWDDPVEIAILKLFVVLVLSDTELLKVVPVMVQTEVQAF